jgi:hypothetical protein
VLVSLLFLFFYLVGPSTTIQARALSPVYRSCVSLPTSILVFIPAPPTLQNRSLQLSDPYHLNISLFLSLQSRRPVFSKLARNPQAFYFRQQTSGPTHLELLTRVRISFRMRIRKLLSSNSRLTLLRFSPFTRIKIMQYICALDSQFSSPPYPPAINLHRKTCPRRHLIRRRGRESSHPRARHKMSTKSSNAQTFFGFPPTELHLKDESMTPQLFFTYLSLLISLSYESQ